MPVRVLTSGGRRRLLAACVVAAIGLTGGCTDHRGPATAGVRSSPNPGTTSSTPSPTANRTSPAPQSPPAPDHPQGDPKRVVVTSSGGRELVDARLVPSRLDDHGILAPPPGVAGWYAEKGWPEPGYPGASVLAGHINTRRNGPDTFARLPEVRPGDLVTVTYSSGDQVRFVVDRSAAVPKKQTPKDDTIWDAGNPRPLLRLITCDPTTPVKGGHYVGNWVVWATADA